MNTLLWIIQVLLAVISVASGSLKVFATPKAREYLSSARRHGDAFVRFVGTTELLAAAGLLLPMLTGILPWLTPVAALGLALIQILAIFTEHLPAREFQWIPINVILILLELLVAYGRFTGLS